MQEGFTVSALSKGPRKEAEKKKIEGPRRVNISTIIGDKCSCRINIKQHTFRALVDTGADVSLISEDVYNKIGKRELSESSIELSTVDGGVLTVLGEIVIEIQIGSQRRLHCFCVVRGITTNVILGCDFIAQNEIKLVFNKKAGNMLMIGSESIPLEYEQYMRSFVRLKENLKIPPQSSMMVNGVCRGQGKKRSVCIIQQIQSGFLAKEPGLLVTNSVSNVRGNRPFPITIVNTTNKTFGLKKGNVVATVQSVSQEDISDLLENEGECEENGDLSVPEQYRIQTDSLVERNLDLFAKSNKDLGKTDLIEIDIETGNHEPIALKPYRVPLAKRQIIDEQVQEMLEAEVIRPSRSPWSFPVVIVGKKDNSWRFAVDYRQLNQITQKYNWPLEHISDILATLGRSKYFSSLDLKSGYWQVPVNEKDKQKTAFTCHKGLFEFNVMPFGLTNAPSIFSELMSKVVGDLPFVIAYLDDLIIFSETEQEHFEHLQQVFNRLREAKLKLKRAKCEFFREKINYLGHTIDKQGVRPDEDKVRAIKQLPAPTDVTGVRSFIGMTSFYRSFIPNFSEIALPLTKLTKKNMSFSWDASCEKAFNTLKEQLVSPQVLSFPDLGKPFILYTDASGYCIGALLAQVFDDGEKPIQYLSHQLSDTQKRWPVIEREAYAIVYAIQKFRHFLQGAKFTIMCDHKPLKYIFSAEMKNPKVQRWAMAISEFNCDIQYLQGKLNTKADCLSRVATTNQLNANTPQVAYINTDVIDPRTIRQLSGHCSVSDTETEVGKKVPLFNDDTLDIASEQDADPILAQLKTNILQNKVGKNVKEKYSVLEGILYYIPLSESPSLKLVVPETLKALVLHECHEQCGHMGIDKTYDRIKSKYHWRGLYKDICEYISLCVECQSKNMKKELRPLQQMDEVRYPFEKIGIDLCGPYPETHTGYKYLLTVIDMFSGWPEIYPIPDKSATTIARVLMDEFFPRHSYPLEILSDNGTEFCNKILDEICKYYKIYRARTSKYHARSNGKVERLHRVWNDMVSKQLGEDARTWDLLIPGVLHAIRTSTNDTSKYSPFYLVNGREPILPLDTLLKPRLKYLGEDYSKLAMERQHVAFRNVARNVKKGKELQRKYHDRKATIATFQPGDPVYLFNNIRKHKFSRKWQPYFRILSKNHNENYTIKSVLDGSTQKVHSELLKHAKLEWVIPKASMSTRAAKLVDPNTTSESSSDSESSSEEGRGVVKRPPKQRWVPQNSVSESESDSSGESDDNIPLAQLRNKRLAKEKNDSDDDNIPLAKLCKQERKITIKPEVSIPNIKSEDSMDMSDPENNLLTDMETQEHQVKRPREGDSSEEELGPDVCRRKINVIDRKEKVKQLLSIISDLL